MKIYIIGAGPYNEDLLTARAIKIINSSDVILTTRHFEKCDFLSDKPIKILSIDEICDFLRSDTNNNIISVLASGDVGFYSIANTIKNRLGTGFDIEFVSGISSFQYLTSKLLLPYEKIKLVSLHGKNTNIIAHVCYNEYVFCLTDSKNSPANIINSLYKSGLCDVKITVGENLSYDNEKIRTDKISDLLDENFGGLSTLLIHNENFTYPHKLLYDEDFIRAKIPMTKQIIRDSAVSLLDVSPTDTIYDVGAGTGSVSIAMAKKAFEGTVYAIEKNENAVELIAQNITKLRAFNTQIIADTAPNGIENLPPADKVFIGGSTGNLKEIVNLVLEKNNHATIMVTAVTLQTLTQTLSLFEEMSLSAEIFNVTVAKSQRLGRYDLMMGENPVYIIKGQKLI